MGDALREVAAHFGVEFDSAALEKGEGAISQLTEKLKGVAGAVGAAFAVKEIFEFTVGLTEQADALAKQSRTLGISMGELQEWGYIADLAGVKATDITRAMTRLTSGKAKLPPELGVSLTDAAGKAKTGAQLFEEVGDALAKIDDPAKKGKYAMAAFGKQGLKLLPVFEDGAEGIAALRKEFQEMGGGFSDDFGKKSEVFNDNITRIKTLAKQVGINIVDKLMPAFLSITVWFVKAVKLIIPVIKQSRVLEAGLVSLAIGGVLYLSAALGGLGAVMSYLLLTVAPLVIAFLLLEDLIGFFSGDESLTGDILTNFFGKDTTEKVRGFIKDVKGTWDRFISEIKGSPQTLADDWEVFVNTLSKDVTDFFGSVFGGILNTAGGMFLTFVDLLTGGWDNFTNKIGAVWAIVMLGLKIPFFEVAMAILSGVASMKDGFADLWNTVLQGAIKVVDVIGKVAGALGAKGVGKSLVNSLGGMQLSEDNSSAQSASAYKQRMGFTADYDAAQARLNAGTTGGLGGIGGGVNATTAITVNVPPGTPNQQAAAVAQAAKSGVQQGLNLSATQAATTAGGAR